MKNIDLRPSTNLKAKLIVAFLAIAFFAIPNEASAQWTYQSSSVWNTIYRYGNVGIYGYPYYKLDVKGSFRCYNLYTTSDQRYKKNISDYTDALETISQLRGVEYDFDPLQYNDETDMTPDRTIGFIAQEVKEVLPNLVSQDNEGIYSVNYQGVIPVLTEGIKAQQKIIVDQKEEIDNLKKRMDKLEAMLSNNSTKATSTKTDEVILQQNSPNPFGSVTNIKYQLPDHIDQASLVVYDLNGRMVVSYDITTGSGSVAITSEHLKSGTYVYTINAKGQTLVSKKMVIRK